MSIVVQSTNLEITTTAQAVMDDVAQDMRQQLQSNAVTFPTAAGILLDYVNRTHNEILRAARWPWMVSRVQRFLTRLAQSDYWIGAPGNNPQGTVDSNLGLTDVFKIKKDSVYDRSNFKRLGEIGIEPLNINMQYRDTQGRPGRPTEWRQDINSPYVLSIYPPPDNQNGYQMVPEAPYCHPGSLGGSLPATTYYVRVTFLDSEGGESANSVNEVQIFIPTGQLLVVEPPSVPFYTLDDNVNVTQWNAYVGSIANGETKQNTTPLNLNQAFVLPPTGLINGAALPVGTSTLQTLNGYVIEFQYYRQRVQLTSPGQYLQIPDDYKEVVTAGTNMRVSNFLKHSSDSAFWMQLYREGIVSMIRDKNNLPSSVDFIRPDDSSIAYRMPGFLDYNMMVS